MCWTSNSSINARVNWVCENEIKQRQENSVFTSFKTAPWKLWKRWHWLLNAKQISAFYPCTHAQQAERGKFQMCEEQCNKFSPQSPQSSALYVHIQEGSKHCCQLNTNLLHVHWLSAVGRFRNHHSTLPGTTLEHNSFGINFVISEWTCSELSSYEGLSLLQTFLNKQNRFPQENISSHSGSSLSESFYFLFCLEFKFHWLSLALKSSSRHRFLQNFTKTPNCCRQPQILSMYPLCNLDPPSFVPQPPPRKNHLSRWFGSNSKQRRPYGKWHFCFASICEQTYLSVLTRTSYSFVPLTWVSGHFRLHQKCPSNQWHKTPSDQ